MNRRILAVDPGDVHIGLAISDPTGTIANPLQVLNHVSRLVDAAGIARLAQENGVELIVVGQAFDEEGLPNLSGRKASRLAEAIQTQTSIPVRLWDESGSTQAARSARIALGVRRSKRRGHMDDLAAVVILQTYLDAHMDGEP